MNKELEVVPISEEKKYELMTIGEEGSTIKVLTEGNQLPALADGSVVISSKLQAHEHLKPSYQVSTFSMDELAAGNMFDPYNGLLQMVLNQAREAMTKNDKMPRPKRPRVLFSSMYGFEEEQAMSLVDPNLLAASLSRISGDINMELVVQTVDSFEVAYTYQVKAPTSDKKRFRLWLRVVFRDKRRKKLVVTNQEELSSDHQQLLETALERIKEKPFLLDEFHQIGGVESE